MKLTEKMRGFTDEAAIPHGQRLVWLMPVAALLFALILWLLPSPESETGNISLRTLELPEFPIVLVLEQDNGTITSAWIRTPAGARKLEQLEGLAYIASDPIISRVDQDKKDDLLWRLSFTNLEGKGVHLWLGMTTWSPRVYISTTPFEYTRWHALPAKIEVPKGSCVYISPAAPAYQRIEKKYSGTESYSFIYTMMMTPEGFAFVPVPSVYRQLAALLKAGMRGETSPRKRMAYVKMLMEFNRLADGKAPQAETLLNFPMEKVDTLIWKK